MSGVAPDREFRLRSVLLATDFSEASETALPHALLIARLYGAKLYFAHVVPPFPLPGKAEADLEAAWRNAHDLEHRLLQGGSLAGLQHEFIVEQGAPWEVLNQIIRQKKIDLIVSGAHGRRGIRKVLLGSVAEQIFRNADCPVFTAGPDSHLQSRVGGDLAKMTFLFPTDFGEASLDAIPDAISYANQFGAKLSLLHVVHTAASPESFLYKASLQMLKDLTGRRPLNVEPEFLVESVSGPVSKQILKTAEALKADLIILGLRRFQHVEAASHAPWPMAYEVVCGAKCPVLTLRC